MFRLRQFALQTSRPRPEQSRSSINSLLLNGFRCAHSRSGLALTEIVLIILVPCFSLLVWGLCDAELKKSLLAGPNRDNQLTVNPVYDSVNMDHQTVATVQGLGQIRIWDLQKSAMIGEMQSHISEIRCVDYSPEQRLLAVGSAMGQLEMWDLEHPETPIVNADAALFEVSECLFTPDGKTLLTSGENGLLLLWNPRTLEKLDTLAASNNKQSVRCLAISPDGRIVIAGTRTGLVQVWDLEQRKLLREHRVADWQHCPSATVESVSLLADGKHFISATRDDGIAVWNIESGACLRRFSGETHGVRSGVISPDQTLFTVGNEHGKIVTWEIATGNSIAMTTARSTIVRSVYYSADGQTLLSGGWDGQVQFLHQSQHSSAAQIAK